MGILSACCSSHHGVARLRRCVLAVAPRIRSLSCEQRASLAVHGKKGATYRPRSVSSLLMRLRAMATVCGCVWWEVRYRSCWRGVEEL
jgi:hypothetical protein